MSRFAGETSKRRAKGRSPGILFALVAAVAVALVGTGCGSSSDSDSGSATSDGSGAETIGLSMPNTTDPFWISMIKGAEDEAAKSGVDLQVEAANNDTGTQTNQVESLITNKVDGLILVPNDATGSSSAVLKANAADVPVFEADSTTESGEYESFISSNNSKGGEMIGEFLAKEVLHGKGQVGILAFDQFSSTADRVKGFEAAIAKYPGIEIVRKLESDVTRDKARRDTENLIAGFPDLNGIFASVGSDTAIGAVQALQAAQREDVKVVSFDSIPESRQLVLDGTPLAGEVAQFPYLLGVLSVQTAVNSLAGKPTPERVEVPIVVTSEENLVDVGGTIRIKGHEKDDGPS